MNVVLYSLYTVDFTGNGIVDMFIGGREILPVGDHIIIDRIDRFDVPVQKEKSTEVRDKHPGEDKDPHGHEGLFGHDRVHIPFDVLKTCMGNL